MPVFLLTDIEGSTVLWEQYGEGMRAALARHDAILAHAVAAHGGVIVRHTGDGAFAVFRAGEPLACALAIQRELAGGDWGVVGEIHTRIAIHLGEAEERAGDFYGPAVNKTIRLCETAWGGEIVVSGAAAVLPLPAEAAFQDLGVHLLRDLGEAERVYRLDHPDLPYREFPPLRSLRSHPNNLPPQATPFVGRESDLAAVRQQLLDSGTRLLTLRGSGGVGKTRLALQAAAAVVDRFEWGVYYVPLVNVSSPDYLWGAIADAVNFTFAPREDPCEQLWAFFGTRELLLVLDNFEHLVAAAPAVTATLAMAPKVKILVTSRERLHLADEVVYEVGGMDLPPSAQDPEFERYESVALFLDCARRARPSFIAAPEDREAILAVCRRLQGIPLALELAAAWIRILSPAEIAEEMAADPDFLESSAVDLPDRHRGLRAVFEYSFGLLTAEEQAVLAAVSLFRRGFNSGAARAVADADEVVLEALADKSLLTRAADDRYEVHHLITQYARAKLEESPEEAARARRRFISFYTDFLAACGPALAGGRQFEATAAIAAEMDNIRAAFEGALAAGDADAVATAAEALFAYYRLRSSFEEGRVLFGDARIDLEQRLRREQGDATSLGKAYARVLIGEGAFCSQLALYREADYLLPRGIAAARRAGETAALLAGLNALAGGAFYRGDLARCRRISNGALRIAESRGEEAEKVPTYINLAFCAKAEGDLPEAKRLYMAALDMTRELGDANRAGIILNNLGNIERALGNADEALELYEFALEAGRELGNRRLTSFALNNLGNLVLERGDRAAARGYFEDSLKIKRELNDRRQMPETMTNLAGVLVDLGEAAAAKQLERDALAVAVDLGLPGKIAHCHERIGMTLDAEGKYEAALASYAEGIRCALEGRADAQVLDVLQSYAATLVKMDCRERALEILGALAPAGTRAPRLEPRFAEILAGARAGQDEGENEEILRRGAEKGWRELAREVAAAACADARRSPGRP